MLRFTDHQIDQAFFSDDRDRVEHIVKFLRERCPHHVEGFPDESLERMTKISMDRARRHGLTGPEDLTHFAALMWEVAPNFDEQPEIATLLADRTLPQKKRLASVIEKTPIEALYAAEEAYDASAWNPESADAASPSIEQELPQHDASRATPGTDAGHAQPQH